MSRPISMKPLEVEGLLSTEEMCHEWSCNRSTIRNMISEGLPVIRFEGKIYFNLPDCQAWYRGEASARGGERKNVKKRSNANACKPK